MITFKQYINESIQHDYHHSSIKKINIEKHNSGKDSKSNYPIWLSHNEHQAEGWTKNLFDEYRSASTYKVSIKGPIANHADPKIKNILKNHDEEYIDAFHANLSSNPEAEYVHSHPIVKELQKHGYIGYSHPDYDPHDFSKDHDSTVIFNRRNTTIKKE